LKALIIEEETFKSPSVQAEDKATRVREVRDRCGGGGVECGWTVHEEYKSRYRVLYDAEDLECVFPHTPVTEEVFEVQLQC
jgi:hypothetical protein